MQCRKCGSEMYATNDEWADGFVTGFTCIYCENDKEEKAIAARKDTLIAPILPKPYTVYIAPDGTKEELPGASLAVDDTACPYCGSRITVHQGWVHNGDFDTGGAYWRCTACNGQAFEVKDSPHYPEYPAYPDVED